jgi:AcrR family transcriptional regulator
VGARTPIDTHNEILETAKTLLRRYGHDKMTVVDIARALGMSHANVYRFFRNKSEILDAIIDEWLSKLERFVEDIALRPIPAAARIEAVVLELHRRRKQKLLKDGAFFETYRRVVEVRPDVAAKRREKVRQVFKRLIEEGTRSGEFAGVDAARASTVLKDATSLFLHPFLIPTTLNEPTEARARNVVRFVLAGFASQGRLQNRDVRRESAARRAG